VFDPDEDPEMKFPTTLFGCKHKPHSHLCDGVEELMHLLHLLGVSSSHGVLMRIGLSASGRRYGWLGRLIDRGHWSTRT